MAGDWTKAKWGALAVLDYGKALHGYSQTEGKARVFGTNGPIGWYGEALWDGPGVIVGRKGAYRGVHYSDGPYWVIDTAYSLRPKINLNLRWAYYQLKHLNINNIDDGSPIPSTTRDAFYAQEVLLPSRDEQDRIATVLTTLDDKIAVNRRIAETLEAIARALFKSWFVDFDPVHAKAKGRPTGLPGNIGGVFPDHFDKGLPTGWCLKRVGDLFEITIGRTPPRKESEWFSSASQGIPWASIRDMGNCEFFIRETAEALTEQAIEKFNFSLLQPGSVLMSFKLTVGRIAITQIPIVTNEAIAHFTFNEQSVLSPVYTYLALKAYDFESLGSTSSIATAVNSETVRNMSLLVPDDNVGRAFNAIVEPLFRRISAALDQSRTLADLRDALLPSLISGEIRLADAEKKIVAA